MPDFTLPMFSTFSKKKGFWACVPHKNAVLCFHCENIESIENIFSSKFCAYRKPTISLKNILAMPHAARSRNYEDVSSDTSVNSTASSRLAKALQGKIQKLPVDAIAEAMTLESVNEVHLT
jgi:hypothetical protein